MRAPAAVVDVDAAGLDLRTALVTTEAPLPEMRRRGGGSFLFTASTSGLVGSGFGPVSWMCRFGVVGLGALPVDGGVTAA